MDEATPSVEADTSTSHMFHRVQDKLCAQTGQSLDEFIAQRRERPDGAKPVPFRLIANELVKLTGIDLTYEAVRRWHHAAVAEAEEAASRQVIAEAKARQAVAAQNGTL